MFEKVKRFISSSAAISINDILLGFFMFMVCGLGLLKGYELVLDARVRNLADQAVKIQSSYYKFIDFYRQIPGDWGIDGASLAIPGIESGGNGNGVLDAVDGDPWTESLAVWEHLYKAKFLDTSYIRESEFPGKGVARVPVNAFGGPMILFSSRDYYDHSDSPPKRVGLILGRGTPVSVLAKLDKKIDDGYPATGVIRHVSTDSETFGEFSRSVARCVDGSKTPPVWLTDDAGLECNAIHLY